MYIYIYLYIMNLCRVNWLSSIIPCRCWRSWTWPETVSSTFRLRWLRLRAPHLSRSLSLSLSRSLDLSISGSLSISWSLFLSLDVSLDLFLSQQNGKGLPVRDDSCYASPSLRLSGKVFFRNPPCLDELWLHRRDEQPGSLRGAKKAHCYVCATSLVRTRPVGFSWCVSTFPRQTADVKKNINWLML